MGSLTAHLTEPELHGRLPFHPECPICRQTRLAGTLRTGGLLPARVPASLAAGLLAASLVVPGPALAGRAGAGARGDGAAESDRRDRFGERPGLRSRRQFHRAAVGAPAARAASPGGAARPPSSAPAGQPAPAASASGEEDDPVVDNGDGTDPNAAPAQPDPDDTSARPRQPATPPSRRHRHQLTAPASPPPTAARGGRTAGRPATIEHQADRLERSRARRCAPARPRSTATGVVHRQQPPAGRAPAPAPPRHQYPRRRRTAPAASATARTAPEGAAGRPRARGAAGRVAVAIASDLLGRDAGAARIAREVHRLWELNKDADRHRRSRTW